MIIKIFLYWRICEFSQEGGQLDVSCYGGLNEKNGYVLLAEQDVDFDLPNFDKREFTISCFKAKKTEIIREATEKAAAIEEKIQQLLALDAPEKSDGI